MILFLDTTNFEEAGLALKDSNGKILAARKFAAGKLLSEKLLTEIQALLDQGKINLGKLTAIEVKEGPGGFTSTRIGVAAANALAFALRVPINGKPAGGFARPIYGDSSF